VVGYAHLDTEWRWEYPQVIDEYIRKTMEDNFKLFDKYPHYVFNFSGANRYRFMKEYFPADFARLKKYVDAGRWFPAGSSMEEGDVNAPSAEGIIRQILYGNDWFRKELGKASAEYMLPDCFGFPASLPTILAHSGREGILDAEAGVGIIGRCRRSGIAGENAGRHAVQCGRVGGPGWRERAGRFESGSYRRRHRYRSQQAAASSAAERRSRIFKRSCRPLRRSSNRKQRGREAADPKDIEELVTLRSRTSEAFCHGIEHDRDENVIREIGRRALSRTAKSAACSPTITITARATSAELPEEDPSSGWKRSSRKGRRACRRTAFSLRGPHPMAAMKVGDGPVHVISANAEQMFLGHHALAGADFRATPAKWS
jgi:alpha-mannosidase